MTRGRLLQPAPAALLSLTAVVVLLVADIGALTRFGEARAYADRTSDISITLQKTLTALVDAETASRGFLLTGDDSYLRSFEQAESEVPQGFATLRRLTADSPLQQRRVAELEDLSTARSAFMEETVRLVIAGQTEAAIAAVREGAGSRAMEHMREVSASMAADEDALFRSRLASAHGGFRVSMVVLVVAEVGLLGLAAMLFGIDRDVQRRRSLEQSLQATVHVREQMLAIVSHDLRNPLAVVMMAAKLIERTANRDPSGDRMRKSANAIIHEAERMNRLVMDLLDVSKIEAGRSLPVAAARRDGAELLKRSVERFESLARARGLKLEVHAPPGRYDLDCDAERLHQVFANLIGNAIKFTPSGGTITAKVAHAEGDIVFSIGDTGTGIPEAQVSRLFEPYWQAGADRSGAGLGLSIVKAIVQAHRGRVWVETEEGAGSTFYCALPAAARAEVPQPLSSKLRESGPRTPNPSPTPEGPNERR